MNTTTTPPIVAAAMASDGNAARLLNEMDHKSFYAVVDRDVRGQAPPHLAAELRSAEVVERWYATLTQMKKSVEGTLAAKAADAKIAVIEAKLAKDEAAILRALLVHQKWRAGAIRFKTGVEERLIEAKTRRNQVRPQHTLTVAEERDTLAQQLTVVLHAIAQHRLVSLNEDDDSADRADDALWGLLDA